MNVDTGQIRDITIRLAKQEAQTAALLKAFEVVGREAGLPAPAPAAPPAPRHARRRGHLRLVQGGKR